ncbi:hypothetical protein GFL91_20400 [Rhizobium leguminosarum bv. viciae]|uniref:Uncharacterized protein n=1 Tax=Rhizobium leguminosarum bv. viciae TaxID=387 RepID=A0A8I2GVH2_RHILV|nr:hypothetical protein CHY08_30875 [Rhizobium leguminosarum bv. viciae]NKM47290.1 hypothetical protein [Rhizobium leguminosarum bv. viciae]NKN01548.1 hypothetical protein [Rhizobium leguminosarum bv. viciae]
MERSTSAPRLQALMGTVAFSSPPSFLCLSQESSAPESSGAGDLSSASYESFTAQTRSGWIPVAGTGMRECGVTASHRSLRGGHR